MLKVRTENTELAVIFTDADGTTLSISHIDVANTPQVRFPSMHGVVQRPDGTIYAVRFDLSAIDLHP